MSSRNKYFPCFFGWRQRHIDLWKAARKKQEKIPEIDNSEATKRVLVSSFREAQGHVDINGFTSLAQGSQVQAWSLDEYSGRQEIDSLVALMRQEVVIEKSAKDSQTKVRVQHPRWNYRLEAAATRMARRTGIQMAIAEIDVANEASRRLKAPVNGRYCLSSDSIRWLLSKMFSSTEAYPSEHALRAMNSRNVVAGRLASGIKETVQALVNHCWS
jgi:hypothetical protein